MITTKKPMCIEDLRRFKLERPPQAGRLWVGRSHYDLASTVAEQVTKRGWGITGEHFTVGWHDARMAGVLDLTIPGLPLPKGNTLALGMAHGNDCRRAVRLAVGSTVLVCMNGLVTGDIVLRKKHTAQLNFTEELNTALDEYLLKAEAIPGRIKELQINEVPNAADLMLAACRKNVIPWNLLKRVDDEWRHPSHPEHGRGTAWALLNAFTFVLKDSPPLQQMQRISGVRALIETSIN